MRLVVLGNAVMFIQGRLPPASSGEALEKRNMRKAKVCSGSSFSKAVPSGPTFQIWELGDPEFQLFEGEGPMQRQQSTPPSHLESCLQRRRRRIRFLPLPASRPPRTFLSALDSCVLLFCTPSSPDFVQKQHIDRGPGKVVKMQAPVVVMSSSPSPPSPVLLRDRMGF